jgi:hypothetical protein
MATGANGHEGVRFAKQAANDMNRKFEVPVLR